MALLEEEEPLVLERVILLFLSFLASIYSLLVRLRCFLYRVKILKSHALSVPVVSVGNINLGGTGKTPVVELLAKIFLERGKKVGILSRGYGRRAKGAQIERVVYDPNLPLRLQAEKWGDEPLLLAKHLPTVPIYVGKDRVAAGKKMLSENSVDLILLDDGFQHLRLRRQVDLVIVDAQRDLQGKLFPRGFLREPLSHLKRATALICKEPLKKIQTPIFSIQIRPSSFISIETGEKIELASLKEKRALIFSGIGRPESFEQSVRQLGVKIVGAIRYPDHHYFSQDDQQVLFELAHQKGADCLLTTEKDAMRWKVEKSANSAPIYFLKISAISEALKNADCLSRL